MMTIKRVIMMYMNIYVMMKWKILSLEMIHNNLTLLSMQILLIRSPTVMLQVLGKDSSPILTAKLDTEKVLTNIRAQIL